MAPGDEAVRTIRFEVIAEDGDPDQPRVSILIDGDPIFEALPKKYVGLDPDNLFLAQMVLLPVDPPARVAPYSCSCGEAGWMHRSAHLRSRGPARGLVGPRDFTGQFWNAASREYPDPASGEPIPIGDLVFDRAQYEAELARATTDRRWETTERATARTLRRLIADEEDSLLPPPWRLGWVEYASWLSRSGSGPVYNVGLHHEPDGADTAGGSHMVLALRPEPAGAEGAADMLLQLRSTPHHQWATRFRDHW